MSLYVKVFTNFYTHRKTMRLRSILGDDAFWVPPRLWAYAAENQPDGDFSSYTDPEIAMLLGYNKDATSLLQALISSGFVDHDRKIHDWAEHNSYHQVFADRARKAALAKWGKEKKNQKEKEEESTEEQTREDRSQASLKNASSILEAEGKGRIDRYHPDCRAVLHYLNETACVHYREVHANLNIISQRLFEDGVTLEGVQAMIRRQSRKWRGTEFADYLRPETLFRKSKFDGYYAARDEPLPTNGKPDHRAERAAKEYQQVITPKLL